MSVTLTDLLLGIAVAPFLWVLVDWFLGVMGRCRERKQVRRSVRTCHLCGKSYQEQPRVKLSVCPACEGVNDRRGHRKLG
jgi:protein-arginine kinase activator protein McsA